MFAISKNSEERNPTFYPIYNISAHLFAFTAFNKKDELLAAAPHYPILWDGHPAILVLLAGFSARTTRNFWVFF